MAAAASCYAASFAVLRVQHFYFPSNPISMPSVLGALPGVSAADIPVGHRVTIALLGMDYAMEAKEPLHDTRSDSLMLMTIDPKTKTGGILSIPRDTFVKIPDPRHPGSYMWDRVNTAYEWGYIYHYPGGGPQLLKDTLQLNYGITVDYYIVVDWSGFVKIVNAVGGVDIHVTKYLYSDQVQIPERHQDYAEFKPGTYHMDGEVALAYARMRPDSDFGRIQRQQQVLMAVARKALSLGMITSPRKMLSVYRQYQKMIITNIPNVKVPGLAQLALAIGIDKLRRGSFGPGGAMFPNGAVTSYIGPGCADMLLPLPGASGQIAAHVFGSQAVGAAVTDHLLAAGYGNRGNFKDYSYECGDSPSSPATSAPAIAPTSKPQPSSTPTPRSTATPVATRTPVPSSTPVATHTPAPTATTSTRQSAPTPAAHAG